jgi:phage terminase large subunit-like protein
MQTGRGALLAYRHDRNPVLGRCPGNVVGRPDRRGNLYPAKQRPEQKTDAAVALMMAVGRAMAEDDRQGDLEDFLRNPIIA